MQLSGPKWDRGKLMTGDQRGRPPDPHAADDVPGFIAQLNLLWEWGGSPGYRKTLQAMADRRLGPGELSGTTVWRVLTSRQDLTRVREPERFVQHLVTVLGADPSPWLAVLRDLLRPAAEPDDEEPRDERPWWRSLLTRKAAVVAGVCVVVAGGVVAWSVTGDSPVITAVDYSRPVRFESTDSGLYLAVDRDADEPAARAVLTSKGTTWEMVAPHRNNDKYRQVRPAGKLLMCLEVNGGVYEERAAVQQWGCNGEPHQYWMVQPDPTGNGMARLVNMNSDQCLTVVGARPAAGRQLVQRTCVEDDITQQWRVTAGARVATTASKVLMTGPDPAEFPGGGQDLPCDGIGPALDPATTPWLNQPHLIRDEESAHTRGKVTLGPGEFGAVEMLRADTTTDGVRETYYWAEGWVKFTPRRFHMFLQWTRRPGPGDWHTCDVPFTVEHGRPATVALPRDLDRDGTRDVWFRICIDYAPESGSPAGVVNCGGRY